MSTAGPKFWNNDHIDDGIANSFSRDIDFSSIQFLTAIVIFCLNIVVFNNLWVKSLAIMAEAKGHGIPNIPKAVSTDIILLYFNLCLLILMPKA